MKNFFSQAEEWPWESEATCFADVAPDYLILESKSLSAILGLLKFNNDFSLMFYLFLFVINWLFNSTVLNSVSYCRLHSGDEWVRNWQLEASARLLSEDQLHGEGTVWRQEVCVPGESWKHLRSVRATGRQAGGGQESVWSPWCSRPAWDPGLHTQQLHTHVEPTCIHWRQAHHW